MGQLITSEMKLQNIEFIKCDAKKYLDNVSIKFDLVISCAVHRWIGLELEDYLLKLKSILNSGGQVLFESQGQQSTTSFETNIVHLSNTLSKYFKIQSSNKIIDDRRNLRRFWVLECHDK